MSTFRHVTGKIGNMRKSVEWTVCPVSNAEEHEVTIQSDRRIARVNLQTGKVILSDGKGGHQGFMKLMPFLGATEHDCPTDIMEQLGALQDKHGTAAPVGPVKLFG